MLHRNTAGYIEGVMVVSTTGAPFTTGTVYCYVKRMTDSNWLYAAGTWSATEPTGANIPTMTHGQRGVWYLSHTPADQDDNYIISCIDSGATCLYDSRMQTIEPWPSSLNTILESTHTLADALRIILAFVGGETSGADTTSIAFRDIADSKDRIAMTVDSVGNRSAVTLDGS